MSDLDLEFDAFLADAAGAVHDELGDDGGYPDFAAVVARAHELDPKRITEQALADVAHLAPVVSMQTLRRRRSTRDDVAMAAFVAEVRASVDVDVAESFAARATAAAQVGAPRPQTAPAPVVELAPRSSRVVWGVVLAAAAALLVVSGAVISGVVFAPTDAASVHEAALHDGGVQAPDGQAALRSESAPSRTVAPDPEPELELAPIEAEPELESDPVVVPADPTARKRSQPAPSLSDLDAAARQAWRDGDLDEAKRQFGRVVSRGGTGRLAEMAYGDLFAIARQQSAPDAEAKLWRAYLKRFPAGAFADDASAGLCRRASPQKRAACWTEYIAEFPAGTHVKAAKRELSRAETDAP